MNRYNQYMERVSISEDVHNKIMRALMDAGNKAESESLPQQDRPLQKSGALTARWVKYGQWAAIIVLGAVILSLLVFRNLSMPDPLQTNPLTPTLAGNEMHDVYLIKTMDDGGEKGSKLNQKETETILYWLKQKNNGTDNSAAMSSAFQKTTLNDGEVLPYGVYLYVNGETYILVPEIADEALISFFETLLKKYGLR